MTRIVSIDSARRAQQNQFLDQLIAGRLHNQPRSHRPNPPSLRPDEQLMFGCAVGDPAAKAVRDSWKFIEQVRIMSGVDLDELFARCNTTFNGREAD